MEVEVSASQFKIGYLSTEYKGQLFHYAESPQYEAPIASLIARTFAAEIVRRQWLNKRNPDCMKAIADLPMKPFRDLLGDLMAAHIISGARITDDVDVDLESMVNKITTDEQDRGRVLIYLKSNRAICATLETPDASLQSIEFAMRHERSDLVNVNTELYVFQLVGLYHVIEMTEQKWSSVMIFRASVVIAFGMAQVAVGALIQMKFAGMMTHAASGLMSEGLSDIAFAMSALWSGNNFTWADYGRHKLMSIAITAGSMSIAAVCSRGVKFFQYGQKTVGPTFKEGGKLAAQSASALKLTAGEITKEVVITSCKRIGENIAFGFIDQQIESIVNSQLSVAFRKMGSELMEKIHQMAADDHFASMRDNLGQLYRLHGPLEAQRLAYEKMKSAMTSCVRQAQQWLSTITSAVALGLAEATNKRRMAGAVNQTLQTANSILSVINLIVSKFSIVLKLSELLAMRAAQFKAELQKCSNQRTSTSVPERTNNNISEDDVNRFQCKVQEDFKKTLSDEASHMMQSFTTQMLQAASRHVAITAVRHIKTAYRNHKEKGYREELRRLREERRKSALSEGGGPAADDKKLPPPSEAHIKACLALMQKTKDPLLFAALIREGVPADRFCVDAISCALPTALKKLGIDVDKLPITIESSDNRQVHDSSGDSNNSNALVINVERAVYGQSLGHFYSPNSDSNAISANKSEGRYDCLFDCVAQQIKEKFDIDLDPAQLREIAATMVEKDENISNAIRNGWHQYTLQQGFYGGEAQYFISREESFGITGPYGKVKMHSSQYNMEADHQPATSMWQTYAKDDKVKNLHVDDFPAMSIPIELHRKTLNFGRKAILDSEFNQQQRKYMAEGNYMEAIFHAVNENWLKPIFRDNNRWTNVVEKVYNSLTTDYLETCKNLKLLRDHEAEELKARFTLSYKSYNQGPSTEERNEMAR